MKKLILQIITLTMLLSGIAGIQSCSNAEAESNSTKTEDPSAEIPELLERPVAIGNFDELDMIRSTYGNQLIILKKDPKDLEARLKLVEIFMTEARITGEHGYYFPAALKLLNYISDQNPSDKDIQFRTASYKASVYASLHQFDKALELAEKAVSINPYNAQNYGVLVDAHVELGNYDKAVEMADKMISIRPDLRSYSRVSYLREIYGDVDGAIEAMKMAVAAGYPGYEQSAWARLALGHIYEIYGDLTNAEAQYRMALQERPNYPFAIAALGDIEAKKGNEAEAEKYYKEAMAIIPEFSFYEKLALMYKDQGKTEEVDKLSSELIQMFEEDEAAGHIMSLEYANFYSDLMDNQDKALEYALKEYERRPENIDVNKALAKIYYKKDNYSKANDHLTKATVTNSKDPEILLLKGLVLQKNKKGEGKKFIMASFESNPYQSGPLAKKAKNEL